jgi:hypothetical protein
LTDDVFIGPIFFCFSAVLGFCAKERKKERGQEQRDYLFSCSSLSSVKRKTLRKKMSVIEVKSLKTGGVVYIQALGNYHLLWGRIYSVKDYIKNKWQGVYCPKIDKSAWFVQKIIPTEEILKFLKVEQVGQEGQRYDEGEEGEGGEGIVQSYTGFQDEMDQKEGEAEDEMDDEPNRRFNTQKLRVSPSVKPGVLLKERRPTGTSAYVKSPESAAFSMKTTSFTPSTSRTAFTSNNNNNNNKRIIIGPSSVSNHRQYTNPMLLQNSRPFTLQETEQDERIPEEESLQTSSSSSSSSLFSHPFPQPQHQQQQQQRSLQIPATLYEHQPFSIDTFASQYAASLDLQERPQQQQHQHQQQNQQYELPSFSTMPQSAAMQPIQQSHILNKGFKDLKM